MLNIGYLAKIFVIVVLQIYNTFADTSTGETAFHHPVCWALGNILCFTYSD